MPHPKAGAAPAQPPSIPPAADGGAFEPPPAYNDDISNLQDPGYNDGVKKKKDKSGKKKAAAEPEPIIAAAPLPVEEEEEQEGEFIDEPPEEEGEGEEYYEEEEEEEQAYDPEEGQPDEPLEASPGKQEPEADSKSVASEGKDSEPPDIQVEVAQLHDMVNKCLKTALKGCPCTLIVNGTRVSARYFVDEALEKVTVATGKDFTHAEATVAIAGIQDIFCVPEDGEAAFPAEVINMLNPKEKELLLMVVHQQGPKGLFSRFCLLMNSREGRDGFMEAMRVLCVASRFSTESPTSRPAKGKSTNSVGSKASSRDSATPRQQVSVRFFMRSIGIKALQGGPESGPGQGPPTSVTKASSLIKDGGVKALLAYGFRPKDDMIWQLTGASKGEIRPTISIRVRQHFEAAKHTWYIVETTLRMDHDDCVPRLDWLTPRRLVHLRVHLHDPVKEILGESYARHFAGASFAHRLGLPGTTAQLHRWVNALADIINARKVPPIVVATALNFLEAPNPAPGAFNPGGSEDLVPFQPDLPAA